MNRPPGPALRSNQLVQAQASGLSSLTVQRRQAVICAATNVRFSPLPVGRKLLTRKELRNATEASIRGSFPEPVVPGNT